MKAIDIRATEFASAGEALQHANTSGRGRAIACDGKYLVVDDSEAERLAAAGVEFAFLVDHKMRDGANRIMTIPVND